MRNSLIPIARRCTIWAGGACALDQTCRSVFDSPIDEAHQDEVRTVLGARGSLWVEGNALRQLATQLAVERQWKNDGKIGGEAGLCDTLHHDQGHALRCAESRVSGGGQGIFAVGGIPAGQVMSVYGGTFFSPWDSLWYRIGRPLLPVLDGYMLCQADTSSMDGASQTACIQRMEHGYVSPLSCGQLANHPPAGVHANAGFLSVNVPRSPEFSCLPVRTIWSWFGGHPRVVTLLISLVQIPDNAEVFVDYNFDGSDDVPAWYTPCKKDVSTKTIGKVWKGPSLRMYIDHSDAG